MPYDIVSEEEAPPPPKKTQTSPQIKYFKEIIGVLEKGQVARITPEGNQTHRGIKISLGRIAKGMGKKVESWSPDGDERVFVKVVEE